ncbi:MAG TPA: hypothetical protein VKU40_08895 [Thermoanaerobaculia bacterium]|nr:hypothetical protein [Thermoanaerobaculia bacterium]
MKTVRNKTMKPLAVPLPGGKTLHLGPGKTGEIATQAADHPPLVRLVEAKELEVFDDRQAGGAATAQGGRVQTSTGGHHPAQKSGRRGDR